jgi:hypothetical protein
MSWVRATAAQAVADVLATIDPLVSVFASPPSTFNPPVYVVGYPRIVNYDAATFGVDDVELPMFAGVGVAEIDRLDAMLDQARKAIAADNSLAGAVMHVRVTEQSNWRILSVAGADVLAADLTLRIRM